MSDEAPDRDAGRDADVRADTGEDVVASSVPSITESRPISAPITTTSPMALSSPSKMPSLSKPSRLSFLGDDRGRQIAHSVMGGLMLVGVALIVAGPRHGSPDDAADRARSRTSGVVSPVTSASAVVAVPVVPYDPAVHDAGVPEKPHVPPWRVASLKGDASVDVLEGTLGARTLAQALKQAGVSRADVIALYRSFEGIHRFDRKSKDAEKEQFIVAKDHAKGTLLAFEHVVSPFDVWQARREDVPKTGEAAANATTSKHLVAQKLDLAVDHKHLTSALALSSDLAKAVHDAGLRDVACESIDDALEGHVDLATLKAGARLRLVATEDWVEGEFARFHVDAVELIQKSGATQRVYAYERDPLLDTGRRRVRFSGYFDEKGQQPYRGTFRSPLPFTRVTSRFNPKRMHPVLHTIKPHNGVDFGATTGTSVFAAAAGTVESVGNGGRCGNMVKIKHANGLTTAYCHLSKFAAGLHAGQTVEPRQLIGYVGQTGSATGPHLHFAVKRGDVFIDPLSLKIDGVRVVPSIDRGEFEKKRAELDIALNGIELPPAAGTDGDDKSTDDVDKDNDKDDLDGEE